MRARMPLQKLGMSRAANEQKSSEVRLPVLCQPTSFFLGFDVRVFDNKVKTERLVCRDDDLIMRAMGKRWANHRRGTAVHLSLGVRTSSSASSYHGVYVR